MDEAQLQLHTLAPILELSRLVSSSLDLSVVFERILTAAQELSGADIVSIMLVDERGELRIVASHGLSAELVASHRFRLGEGIAGWVALHGEAVHTFRLASDPRFTPVAISADACMFVLPLRVRNRTLGVLNLSHSGQRELFSPDVVQMVEIFASHAAIAIENAATATALRFATTRERLANLVHQAAREAAPAAPVIQQILAELGPVLDDIACAVYLCKEAGDSRLVAATPDSDMPGAGWRPPQPGDVEARGWSITGGALEVRAGLPGGGELWLVAIPGRHDKFWHQEERELIHFAAEQAALLLGNEQLVSQEQRSRALSETLSRLAAACNAMVGQDRLLDYILEQLARFIAYDSSGVFLFHDDHYARMVAGRGFREARQGVVLYTGPGSSTWEVQEARRAVYIPDVQHMPGWQPLPDAELIRSWIGTPLEVDGRIIGVLTIDKWVPDAFSEADQQVAQLFADHVAVAINNQRLLKEATTRAAQLQALHRASEHLVRLRDQQTLLDEVARLLHNSFGYYQVYIGLCAGEELEIVATAGAIERVDDMVAMRRYPLGTGLSGYAAKSGETVLANDVALDPRYVCHPQTAATAAELVVPLRPDGQVYGIIAVQSTTRGAFGENDVYLTEAVASLTAIVLQNLRREEELRRAQEQLAHTERMRAVGELASGVAHDFNNLLASILGHTQLLLAEHTNTPLAEELRVIERAALNGAATVRCLASLAQAHWSLPGEPIDLNEIIAESLAITRPHWRDGPQRGGHEIAVLRDLASLPPLAGDGPALRDLLINLIINAVDAMPQGGRLRITTRIAGSETSPLGEPSVRLTVSDTGIGMDDAVRARIFEPFFTTKGPRGTGLGLATSYGIVQRHQGVISVDSAVGRGTTFTVYLPLRRPQLAPAPETVAPEEAHTPRRVLVVDDDPSVRQVLARQIRRLGHEVAEAESGAAALEHLQQEHYDTLCTDLGMPGMSGWELIEHARSINRELATVVVTGWGDQIDPAWAQGRGADAVLTKPFDMARLRALLDGLRPGKPRERADNE